MPSIPPPQVSPPNEAALTAPDPERPDDQVPWRIWTVPAAFVCVVAPVAEELFFRGFIFGALRRWHFTIAGRDLGTWAAAVVTALLFGLVHAGSASPQYLVPLGIFGFVLCLVRWRTGSLYPCMALHSVNNSLALGIAQLHWNAGEVVALAAGSVTLIGALTLPLADRRAAPAT